MKHKIVYTGVILCLLSANLTFAQDSLFSYSDIETGLSGKFNPNRLSNIQAVNEEGFYMKKSDTLYYFDITTQTNSGILFSSMLNKALGKSQLDTLSYLPSIKMVTVDEAFFFTNNQWIWIGISEPSIMRSIPLPDEFDEYEYIPSSNQLLGLIGNNLALIDTTGKLTMVTNDSIEGIVNARYIYREEFGISKGFHSSPTGRYIAFYKKDERQVAQYPLVDINHRIAEANFIRYPMAGETCELTTVHLFDTQNGTTVMLKPGGNLHQYLTNLTFSPDEKLLYVQQLNQQQDTMWLTSYDVKSGQVTDTLFSETSSTYVEPENPLVMSKIHQGSFYYQSERNGYNHVYYYNAKTKKLNQLTKGNWVVTDVLGLSADERRLFFTSTHEGFMDDQLFAVTTSNGKLTKITQPAGVHTVYSTPGYTYFIDSYSDTLHAKVTTVIDAKGDVIKELMDAHDLLVNYKVSAPTYGTIKAADSSTDLMYRMVQPIGMEPGKKYPVVIYVYGGPHVQLIQNRWGGRQWFWQQYLAQNGVASFVLDCRGSDNRGRDFEHVIHRQNGIPQIEDQMQGVEFLKKLDWVDSTRLGVHGWSFGGYMTVMLLSMYPDVFKVGVAGGPVIDWKFYEVMYGERYMDTPAENPEGYDLTNAANYAKNLQAKLLIIQGAQDKTVVWQHALTYINACIAANKQVDHFVYPNHAHNVAGEDRVHLVEKITTYFLRHL